jgi:hypothetical protein
MYKGITNLVNANHDDLRPVHERMEKVENAVSDVARGKVNPPQSLTPSDWQSGLGDERDAQDMPKERPGEGRIIDVLG